MDEDCHVVAPGLEEGVGDGVADGERLGDTLGNTHGAMFCRVPLTSESSTNTGARLLPFRSCQENSMDKAGTKSMGL